MLLNSSSPKAVVRLAVAALSYGLLANCSSLLDDHRPIGSPPNSQTRVQRAVDSVRTALEKDLGNSVPSLNLYIQTPTEKIFASSVPAGYFPITEATNFRFASNTKTFTSTAMLTMYQNGWLNYKAKITDNIPGTNTPYVPNTPEWDFPNKNEITIEQLLQHSAGVYDVDNDPVPGFNGLSYTAFVQDAEPNHQFTTEEMVGQLVKHKLKYDFSPGTGYHYSNTGYSILGYIIARVYSLKSGSTKTYEDYLQDFVVGPATKVPLALRFPVLASDTKMPVPFLGGNERLPGKTPIIFGDYNMSAQVAEGNGYGTPVSLNTFIRTLMKGENVLKPETVKLMQSDVNLKSQNTYALGCFYTKNLGFGHNGERCGTLSLAMYDPATDVSVVAFINLVDKTRGGETQGSTFAMCFNAIYGAAYGGRAALGYPGRP
ncbi:serine hydrolase domain-containing protein [Spirosoma montaniterrae]|uniref:Serine hydrolase n=1 Tax=Spirosoma montaniterrae TaxID=1178516 RepID=A0A1P9WW72_9BACT|nr:serine hydrolase domain-containing protein [Spirosoma montaniterrae]AQG79613.1 serine hydrolase [Spirosoma montaniterrae]